MIGVALFFLQDKFIFRPEKLPADYTYKFAIPFRQIDLPVAIERNLSIIQFTVPDSVRKGIVLYFHGNRSNINRYAQYASNFTRNGYEVWMMDYPGYGKSTGKRTESSRSSSRGWRDRLQSERPGGLRRASRVPFEKALRDANFGVFYSDVQMA